MRLLCKTILLAYALSCGAALAITQAEHDAIMIDLNAAVQRYVTVPLPPPPPPPPVTSWPRFTPDVLDIDLTDQDALLNAKLLDGSGGYDGLGHALHYGDMSGNVDSWNPLVIPSKLSNWSCPPKWGIEPSGLHYLESCTDGTKQVTVCDTCRLIYWNFRALKPAKEYYFRYMVWIDPITYVNDTELGIKQAGLAGDQLELGPTALTDPAHEAGKPGWELQTYRYGFESGAGYGVVEKMGLRILAGRWYTIEEHDRVNTITNGVYNKDGLIEVKVDGVLIWSRNNVQQYGPGQTPQITSLLVQSYHGGLNRPAGKLVERHARIAICSQWCGPASELP